MHSLYTNNELSDAQYDYVRISHYDVGAVYCLACGGTA